MRTISTGDDHLSIAQLEYVARQERDIHYNEEGDLIFRGDYTPEQTSMRQMQLFKIQQEKLDNLLGQVEANNKLMELLKKNFVKDHNLKHKKISHLKVDMEKKKLQKILENKNQKHVKNKPSQTIENMDKSINDIINSARNAGFEVDDKNSRVDLHGRAPINDVEQIVTLSNDKLTKEPIAGQKTFMFSDNDEPLTLTGNQASLNHQKADELFNGPQIDFANKARLINAR